MKQQPVIFFNLFFIITYEIHFINFIIIFLKYFLKIKKKQNLSKYRLKITNKLRNNTKSHMIFMIKMNMNIYL